MMKKTITAGVLALTLAGAGFALAQQGPGAGPGPGPGPRGPRFNAEDVAALTDARIAALKAGLKLTAEQEKNWPAVEAAIRELAKERASRAQARHERMQTRRNAREQGQAADARPDVIARLREGADAMSGRAAGLKKLADAAEPLYKSLDDGQKRRFSLLLRAGGRPGGGFHHHMHRRADAR